MKSVFVIVYKHVVVMETCGCHGNDVICKFHLYTCYDYEVKKSI